MNKYVTSLAFFALTAISVDSYTSVPALNSRVASVLAPIDETLDELMKHYLMEKKTMSKGSRSKPVSHKKKKTTTLPKMKNSVAHGKDGVFNPVLRTTNAVNTRTRSRKFGGAHTSTNEPTAASTLSKLVAPKKKNTVSRSRSTVPAPVLKTAKGVNTRTRSRNVGGASITTNEPASTLSKPLSTPKSPSMRVAADENLDELMESYLMEKRTVLHNSAKSKRKASKKMKNVAVPKMKKGAALAPILSTAKIGTKKSRNFGDAYVFIEEPAFKYSRASIMQAPADKQLDVLMQHYLNEKKATPKNTAPKPKTALKKKQEVAVVVSKMTEHVAHGKGGIFTPVLKTAKSDATPSGKFGGAYTTSSTSNVPKSFIGAQSHQ